MKKSSLFAASAIAILLATPAWSQETVADDGATAESDGEIVVTAQKRAENVQDVPVSIAAFSGEALTKANVVTVQDLSKIATNFSTSKGVASSAMRLNIRGVGAFGNTATEPSVAVFLDGVYIPRAGSIIGSFLDMEGAEVLRGPQGTLFGRNASVGALSLHSAKPKDEFSAHVTGEAGSFDRYRLDAHVNIPLGENVALRVAGVANWLGGYWDNQYDGETYGQQDDYAVRASLKADIGAVEWIIRGDYSKIKGDGIVNNDFDPASVSAAQLSALRTRLGGVLPDTNLKDRVMNQNVTGDLKDRQWGVSSEASLDVAGGTLRLIDSYRDWKNDQLDGDIIFLPIPLASRVGQFASRSHNHELQYISPVNQWLGGRLDMVAGVYYYSEKYRLDEQLNLNAQFCNALVPAGVQRTACNTYRASTGGITATDQDVFQNSRSVAAYSQLNFKIAEPLTLVLGGRYTTEKKTGRYSQLVNTPFAGTLRATEVLTLPDLSEDRFTYRVGLNFKPTEDMLVFGSFSTGYKSGGYNSGGGTPSLTTFGPGGVVVSTKRVFDRETVKNYELGIKSSWLDRALTANMTLFRMDIDGYQDRSFDGTSFVIRNAGALRQQGVEFDAVMRPVRRFAVSASLAYLDSKFTDFPGGTPLPGLPAGSVQNLTGTPANYSPSWSGRVGLDWTGDVGASGMTWNLNTNLSFVSDQRISAVTDNNPQTIQDGYGLLGARVTLNGQDDRWSLALFGSNLTNTQYATGSFNQVLGAAFGLNNGVFAGSTAIRQNHAEPRTYGVSGTIRF